MKKGDLLYLWHMLDAITKIEEYTSGIKYESFMGNHLIQDGLIRQIEIIGEATKRLSKIKYYRFFHLLSGHSLENQ